MNEETDKDNEPPVEPDTGSEPESKLRPEPPALPRDESLTELDYEAMGPIPDLFATVDALLKTPGRILHEWSEGRGPVLVARLLMVAAGAFLVFGFVLGIFSGGEQLWAVPAKVAGGIAVSSLITLPSLYVFSCLGGIDLSLKQAAGILLAGVALVGLVLTALSPVAWIFTQSTESVGFMGFLALIFWSVSLLFGLAFVMRGLVKASGGGTGFVLLWACLFATVTLQMSTSLRPIIGPAEETFLPTEKKFFLEHWVGSMSSRGYD